MKRLCGANEQLNNIHGEGGQHRTGKPLTRAIALGDLADRQYASAEEAEARWDAVLALLRASYKCDRVLLEDEQHRQLVEMVNAAFEPPAMERHQYQQGGLVQLRKWLATATEAEVQQAEAVGEEAAPAGAEVV